MRRLLALPFGLVLAAALGLTGVLLWHFISYLWNEQWILAIVLASGTSGLAAMMVRRRVCARKVGASSPHLGVHLGPNASAIPVAGGVGLLVVLGYLVMFWFGAPGYRSLVTGGVALGGLLGAALIWFRRRGEARPGDASMLHLEGRSKEVEAPTRHADDRTLRLDAEIALPLRA
jgi:hypothetical protein